jgi:hypothetical protein
LIDQAEATAMKKLLTNVLIIISLFLLMIVITSLLLLAFKPDVVNAMQDLAQLAATLYRVDDEILGSAGFGKYYSELYWKHNSELIRIYRSYPDQFWEAIDLTNLYIHHLEALMEGRGDEVRINQEQVDALERHLNWLASVSNPELRADIRREQTRTPLQAFVGLTMDEALDYVAVTWARDFPTTIPAVPIMPTGTVLSTPQE